MHEEQKIREEYQRLLAQLQAMRLQAVERGIELDDKGGGGGLRFVGGDSLLDDYVGRIANGDLPQLLRLGDALDGIEVGSELITIIGAPPGFGKTALAMQIVFEATSLDTNLVAYVANAEMGFDAIARRELTRLTRIKSDYIRFGTLTDEEHGTINEAARQLRISLERVQFDEDPNHEGLLDLLDKPPGVLVIDYVQKFCPTDKDLRVGVGAVMTTLRRLAKAGHAVLALSATKRDQKGKHDSAELGLSSFRESGEVEYQADSAYVLRDNGPVDEGRSYLRKVTLGHVKNRHGAKVDRELIFNMPAMAFEDPREHGLVPIFAEFAEYAEDDSVAFDFGGVAE